MLDITSRALAATPLFPAPEFVRLSLSQFADGRVFASITATSIDPDEPELVDIEVVDSAIASLDDLFALIRTHVRLETSSDTASQRLS